MKCAGLPPACGQAALRTSGGSSTFGAPSSTCSVAPAGQDRLALAGQRRLLGAEPVVPQAAAAERQRREQRGPARQPRVPCHRRVTRPAGSAAPLARPRTPFGAVASCASSAQRRLGLIRLALPQVQQRKLLLGQRMPGIVRRGQRLQPRLDQRRVAGVDLVLRPEQAGEIAQQRIGRGIAGDLVPQRGAPCRSPASAFSAASRRRARVAYPCGPAAASWANAAMAAVRLAGAAARGGGVRQVHRGRDTGPPPPGPAAPGTSATPATRPRRRRSAPPPPRSDRHTASAAAGRVRRAVPHRLRRKCRPRGLPRFAADGRSGGAADHSGVPACRQTPCKPLVYRPRTRLATCGISRSFCCWPAAARRRNSWPTGVGWRRRRQHRGHPAQPARCSLFGVQRQGLLDRPARAGQDLLPPDRAPARAAALLHAEPGRGGLLA